MTFKPNPRQVRSITVRDFYETAHEPLKLSIVEGGSGLSGSIQDKSINRPALALVGYLKTFANKRVQLFGAGEMAFLRDLPPKKQYSVLTEMVNRHIPCIVVSRNLQPTKALQQVCREHNLPLFRSSLVSRDFMNHATLILEDFFAPQVTEHGTLLDVKGIGTLIRGRSGVGKSECALALIERGYSLVADDAVYIKLMGEKELVGTSSELNRGYMECRGLGIVNIGELFGIRAVRLEKAINLIVTFEEWKPGMEEDRTGLEQDYYELLGQNVPHIMLPVRPGRDLARLVEVASMVQALKTIGHNPAQEFNDRLIARMNR